MNIGYLRVSTAEQNEGRQLEGLQLDKTFLDKCSAGTLNRPGLDQMKEFAREGDSVFIHSLDRLGRNVGQVKEILDFFTKKGVKVHLVKESLTIDENATGLSTFILNMLAAFAEFERNVIKERQREGIKLAKAQKKYKGRAVVVTPEIAEQINWMIDCGKSKSEICRHYNISRTTFYKYAKKQLPKYYLPKLERPPEDAPKDKMQIC